MPPFGFRVETTINKMKLLKAHFPSYQQTKSFRRFGLPLLILCVISGCVQSPVLKSPTQISTDTHISSDGKGEFREVGNSTTKADNNQLKLRITTTIEEREGIVYIPNESLPFTGLLQKFYANGKKQYETNIKDGKRNGLDTNWYENGQKKSEINHKDGEFNGLFTYWYENGQKRYEANYKDGKEDGLVTLWNENGQKSGEINYKNGNDGEVVAPEKSSSEENWRTQCSSIASLAEKIMDARQSGVSMAKLMEAANTSKLIESMIIAAYEIHRYSSVEVQHSVIGDFRDKKYLQCLKTLKP